MSLRFEFKLADFFGEKSRLNGFYVDHPQG